MTPWASSAQAITPSVVPPMHEADEREPEEQRARQDRLVDGARLALHEAARRLAVAEADRLEDLRREVHPQRLERQERHAGGDVEDARAEEGDDEPDERAHLERMYFFRLS